MRDPNNAVLIFAGTLYVASLAALATLVAISSVDPVTGGQAIASLITLGLGAALALIRPGAVSTPSETVTPPSTAGESQAAPSTPSATLQAVNQAQAAMSVAAAQLAAQAAAQAAEKPQGASAAA